MGLADEMRKKALASASGHQVEIDKLYKKVIELITNCAEQGGHKVGINLRVVANYTGVNVADDLVYKYYPVIWDRLAKEGFSFEQAIVPWSGDPIPLDSPNRKVTW